MLKTLRDPRGGRLHRPRFDAASALHQEGGSIHRKAGWVFVAGMTAVSLTAFILAGTRFRADPRPQAQQAGVFLFYVALLTGAGVSAGVRVLRNVKSRTAAHRHWWMWASRWR